MYLGKYSLLLRWDKCKAGGVQSSQLPRAVQILSFSKDGEDGCAPGIVENPGACGGRNCRQRIFKKPEEKGFIQ